MTAPISLFVVDDHTLFREGLLRLLEQDPGLRIVGSAESHARALQMLPRPQVDVLILDYDLGDETAVTLVRALRERKFKGRILLVTAGLPNHDALELVKLGVSGIVHKHLSSSDLRRSVVDVANGKVSIEPRFLQSLIASTTKRTAPRTLTPRERDVMRLLLHGLTNKEIGADLGVSEGAVKAVLQQIFAKTGVRTRSQLVRIALEQPEDI